jgi:hypothetical protein
MIFPASSTPPVCAPLFKQAELQYNIALCCYKNKQHAAALKHLADIIEKGMREHPELSVGRYGIPSGIHS